MYCSTCCEPFHPYCAGDELLEDTRVARCGGSLSGFGNDTSKIVREWTCQNCMKCKSCSGSIGQTRMIRCSKCQDPFHLQSCIDKPLLHKLKDLDKLRKIWTCNTCTQCKSCNKKIEPNRRLHAIQEAAAAFEGSDSEVDVEEDESSSSCSPKVNALMLCMECFKQRKKGSFCPVCEVCYDDNDWDSKVNTIDGLILNMEIFVANLVIF